MKEWVWNIFLMIAALSFVEVVLPDGSMQKYLKFIFSLMILGVIVYPLGDAKFDDISAFTSLSHDKNVASVNVGDHLVERIVTVQTKQIQEVYQEKLESLKEDVPTNQIQGISIPWTDIYSNDEEESN